jgi:hypothetical protein
MIQRSGKFSFGKLLNGLNAFVRRSQPSYNVHDYTQHQPSEYTIEFIAEANKYHMTGQGRGICQGDRILLCQDGQTTRYQVQSIEYYASPSNLWAALLIKVR